MLSAALLVAQIFAARSWTIGVGGDVMLNGISPKVKPLEKLAPYSRACSLFIANQEIPLTNSKTPTTRKSAEAVKARTQFILKADPAHIAGIKMAGFDMVSLGNNHSMDYGPAGLSEMTSLLSKNEITYAGAGMNYAEAWSPASYKGGTNPKVGFSSMLAFMGDGPINTCTPATKNSAGLAGLKLGGVVNKKTLPIIKEIVRRTKEQGEMVIIALHWGIEKQTVPTPYQVQLGRAFIDAGADIVLGHHPHVLQGAEIYRGKPIFYSLGNLISPRPGSTALFSMTYEGTEFSAMSILPCSISGGNVAPSNAKAASSELTRFSKLCDSIQSKFPNKNSKKPKIALWPLVSKATKS